MTSAKDILQKDPVLKPVIASITLGDVKPSKSPFTALVHSILSQQLSTQSAAAILRRFQAHVPHPCQPASILNISTQALRGMGLSGRKASYCHNIARHKQTNPRFWNGIHHHSDQEIIDELTTITGVGIWTVQMLLIFNLDRPDVFPVGDLAIRQAMGRLYNIDVSQKESWPRLEDIARPWSPYRSIASRYLWAYRDALPAKRKNR
ncbi:MAG: DNA-3-methyladenine glycosylase 2 family protein [Myxococcota bacterium]|nr:DNA-3-methyladenine glycosylase 2 family protein [Myxococcota bacterium]